MLNATITVRDSRATHSEMVRISRAMSHCTGGLAEVQVWHDQNRANENLPPHEHLTFAEVAVIDHTKGREPWRDELIKGDITLPQLAALRDALTAAIDHYVQHAKA